MDERERETVTSAHSRAAESFVSRVKSRYDEKIDSLFVFGSTARGDATDLASDVDVLVVLAADASESAVSEGLRDVAYDVMLEHGPVVELHVLSRSEFEELRDRGNPFVRNAVSGGKAYG